MGCQMMPGCSLYCIRLYCTHTLPLNHIYHCPVLGFSDWFHSPLPDQAGGHMLPCSLDNRGRDPTASWRLVLEWRANPNCLKSWTTWRHPLRWIWARAFKSCILAGAWNWPTLSLLRFKSAWEKNTRSLDAAVRSRRCFPFQHPVILETLVPMRPISLTWSRPASNKKAAQDNSDTRDFIVRFSASIDVKSVLFMSPWFWHCSDTSFSPAAW